LGKAAFTGRLVSGGGLPRLDPLILAQARTTLSLVVLVPALLLIRGPGGLRLGRRDVLRVMGVGVCGVAVSNYAYYAAIDLTSVATAIILQYTAPIWVLLYMVARRRQRATLQRVSAVALAVIGSALAIGLGPSGAIRLNLAGVIWAQVAALSFAFYNVAGRALLLQHERWRVVVYALAGAALFWMVLNPPWRVLAAHYSLAQWTFLGVFAATSMLLPFSFYFAGLQYLDATRAIVTSCLEPVFAIVFAAIFVGESLRALQVLGVVVVLAATILVQFPEKSS